MKRLFALLLTLLLAICVAAYADHGELTPEAFSAGPVKQTEPIEQTQPAEQAKPTEQAQPTERMQPMEQTQPTEQTDLPEQTKPIEQTWPTEETKPGMQTKLIEQTKPTEQTKPAEQTKPTEQAKPTHTHSYSSDTVAPTCTSQGYTVHTCSCGDSYQDSFTDALGHDWVPIYETYTVDDYKIICVTRCVHCGKGIGTGQDAISHVYEEMEKGNSGQTRDYYEKVKIGSHTEQELVGYQCTRCERTK